MLRSNEWICSGGDTIIIISSSIIIFFSGFINHHYLTIRAADDCVEQLWVKDLTQGPYTVNASVEEEDRTTTWG